MKYISGCVDCRDCEANMICDMRQKCDKLRCPLEALENMDDLR